MRVLFLIIAYNNNEEVASFVQQLDQLDRNTNIQIDIVITDNYGNFNELSLKNVELSTVILKAGKNLGYLKGCSHGLDYYLASNPVPDWVSVSNTDIDLPFDYLDLLKNINASVSDNVGQLSPFIVKSNGVKQNPHIMIRPNSKYYWKQRILHFNSCFGAFYIWLSGKARFKSKRIAEIADSNKNQDINIYCSHGSAFFLSKQFFKSGGRIDSGPFLYGEEVYIGEQLYKLNLRSLCRLKFKVIHNAHGTSQFLSLRKKSKMFRESFEVLHKMFRTADL